MPTALENRQSAGELYHAARALNDGVEAEKRDMTGEEFAQFTQMHDDGDKLIRKAEVQERQTAADELEVLHAGEAPEDIETIDTPDGEGRNVAPTATKEYRTAFASYLRGGIDGMRPEQRATLQADNDIGGGFFVGAEQFINMVLKNVDEKLIVRQLATVYQVGRNDSLGVPTLDGTLTDFAFGAGELTSASEDTGIALGKRELKPRDIARKLIKFSKRLLESNKINVEALIADRVAYALAGGLETAYMTGNGAGQPLGLFTASDDGIGTARDVVTGSATGFTGDGLINIQGTLRDAYQGAAQWMIHRDGITAIRKLKDGNSQYLWQPGLQAGIPNTILGSRYITGERVPNTYTNGLYCLIYGDFSWYWIADAISMSVQRLVETYALTGQIGLLFDNMAADAAPVLAEAFVRGKCGA